ncbi:MAG: hypothetical protein HYY18_01035 [Planctomycetes bacterium]|nr:hypothetical protein [Planctomycetota bacterium]
MKRLSMAAAAMLACAATAGAGEDWEFAVPAEAAGEPLALIATESHVFLCTGPVLTVERGSGKFLSRVDARVLPDGAPAAVLGAVGGTFWFGDRYFDGRTGREGGASPWQIFRAGRAVIGLDAASHRLAGLAEGGRTAWSLDVAGLSERPPVAGSNGILLDAGRIPADKRLPERGLLTYVDSNGRPAWKVPLAAADLNMGSPMRASLAAVGGRDLLVLRTGAEDGSSTKIRFVQGSRTGELDYAGTVSGAMGLVSDGINHDWVFTRGKTEFAILHGDYRSRDGIVQVYYAVNLDTWKEVGRFPVPVGGHHIFVGGYVAELSGTVFDLVTGMKTQSLNPDKMNLPALVSRQLDPGSGKVIVRPLDGAMPFDIETPVSPFYARRIVGEDDIVPFSGEDASDELLPVVVGFLDVPARQARVVRRFPRSDVAIVAALLDGAELFLVLRIAPDAAGKPEYTVLRRSVR